MTWKKSGGNIDGPRKELIDHKGKAQSSNEPSSNQDVIPFGRLNTARDTDITSPVASSTGRLQEAESPKAEEKNGQTSEFSVIAEERKHLLVGRKPEAETQTQEITASQKPDSSNTRGALSLSNSNPVEDMENGHLQVGRSNQASSVMGINKQMNPEIISWTGIGSHNEVSRGPLLGSSLPHELVAERKDSNPSQFQNIGNSIGLGKQHADSHPSFSLKEHWKPISGVENDHQTVIPMRDASMMSKHASQGKNYASNPDYKPLLVDGMLKVASCLSQIKKRKISQYLLICHLLQSTPCQRNGLWISRKRKI